MVRSTKVTFMQTAEDLELQAKVEKLQMEFERTQERMRLVAVDYENLLVHRQSLLEEIHQLKVQGSKRRQAVGEG